MDKGENKTTAVIKIILWILICFFVDCDNTLPASFLAHAGGLDIEGKFHHEVWISVFSAGILMGCIPADSDRLPDIQKLLHYD